MKISVIIPCFNCEKFIGETLDCLLNQSLKEIQIIVVNDGSTDNSGKIIDEYAQKFSNITAVHQKNAGVSAARNNGFDLAKGKYTVFLDGDDLLSEGSLENIFNALEKSNADVALFRVMRFGFGGEEYNPIVDKTVCDGTIDYSDKRLIWNFLVANKCYKTELLRKSEIRFSPLKYSEDGAFFMQFIHAAKPEIIGVFGASLKYRRRTPEEGTSVTQSISLELLKHFCKAYDLVYEAALDSFKENSVGEDYLQEILYKSYFALINEFYRLLWRADDETLAYMGKRAENLKSKMNPETLQKCRNAVKDIGEPIFSKKQIAASPFVSVKAKKIGSEFLNSLYSQSMPIFELIVPKNTLLPEYENITVASAPKGKIVLNLNGEKILDQRFLKVVSLLKRSPKFGFLPDKIIKLGTEIFLKIKK